MGMRTSYVFATLRSKRFGHHSTCRTAYNVNGGKTGGGVGVGKHTVSTVLELVKRLGSVFHKKNDDDHLLDYLLFHRSFIASPSLRRIN
jgi:hypothetical protein